MLQWWIKSETLLQNGSEITLICNDRFKNTQRAGSSGIGCVELDAVSIVVFILLI